MRGNGMELRRALTLAGITIGVLGTLAAPAGARSPADDYVPYQPSGFFVLDWSGAYVGGSLGLAHTIAESTIDVREDALFDFSSLADQTLNYEQSETSITGGIHAGWQKHWGKLVAGVEVGFNALRFDTTTESPLIPLLLRSVEASNIFSLTGRLGYTDGRWLAYGKGGIANAQIDVSYDDRFTGLSSSSSGRETGWTAGVGIEYALTLNLFLGVEYNYLHFRADVAPPPIPVIPAQIGDVDIDIQNVVVRLNYRFHPGCCIAPGGP
jgi:opacity protein-like surface antigen